MVLHGDEKPRVLRLNDKAAGMRSDLKRSFVAAMIHALNGRRKVSTVYRWVDEVSLFIRTTSNGKKVAEIGLRMYQGYSATKNSSQVKLLRSALKYWSARRYVGLAEDLRAHLIMARPPKPRSTIEIQNSVERERPFSYQQVQAILRKIDELYIDGEFSPQDNLLWRLIASEGLRPSQIALLKIGDVEVKRDERGKVKRVNLAVPVVKQHGTPARDYLVNVQLTDPVALAMVEHLEFVESIALERKVKPDALFCISATHWGEYGIKKECIGITSRIRRSRGKLAAAAGLADSDLFTRRFKHTKLTHLAMIGAPKEVLAKSGFQTSTVSLVHYVNLTEEAFTDFEDRLFETHAGIANAFTVKVVDREDVRNMVASHGILDRELTGEVGICTASPCGVYGPNGCYECREFNAFRDGPHKRVLDHLLAEKTRRSKLGLSKEVVSRDDQLIETLERLIKRIKADE